MLTERGCLHGSYRLLQFRVFSPASVPTPMYLRSSWLLAGGHRHRFRLGPDCRFQRVTNVVDQLIVPRDILLCHQTLRHSELVAKWVKKVRGQKVAIFWAFLVTCSSRSWCLVL